MDDKTRKNKSITLVIPVFNEEQILENLFIALDSLKVNLKLTLKVVFVDDNSSDCTSEILKRACEENPNLSYLRLSKRKGSHTAILAGLAHCNTDYAAFVAADLQDPLEILAQMITECERGSDVVWANRNGRDGQSWFEHYSSNIFYKVMERFSNVSGIPFQASFALMTRRAYKALVYNAGPRASLIVEIPALGFRVSTVLFSKPKRIGGQSKWTISRKIMALADAIISSSYVPLRLMTYTGIIISFIGIIYAFFIIFSVLTGMVLVSGWASIMVIALILGGLQILMLGIIGEYLWRVSENTNKRSLYIIEDSRNIQDDMDI